MKSCLIENNKKVNNTVPFKSLIYIYKDLNNWYSWLIIIDTALQTVSLFLKSMRPREFSTSLRKQQPATAISPSLDPLCAGHSADPW